MMLQKLLENISYQTLQGEVPALEVNGLQYDSRKVCPGDLFFCIRGFQTDGHDYAEQAVNAGAVCVVAERKLSLPDEIVQILVQDSREAMARISANYYGRPAERLRMVGVTGTNGKTSTTYMLKSVFEREGSKVGLIGTIVNMIGDEKLHTERTTPESLDLQALLAHMLDEGVDTVVMEVSSHSLALKRVAGIEFDGAIFTNLTQDHLDFHKDMDDYAQAKALLFAHAKHSAVNIDDPYADCMLRNALGKQVRFGLESSADFMAKDIQLQPQGSRFVLSSEKFRLPVLMQIPGKFTVYNALGTAALCLELGVDLICIKQGLEDLQSVPGRFERLDTRGGDYTVILDYSHTPDSLESALKTIRGFAQGRVVCVFGCGGNRDAKKRPIMGEISGRLADFSIVTSDNPRYENPDEIIAQILKGISSTDGQYIAISNRREAIAYAIKHAQPHDVILLAGKGHEDYQEICGVKHPFDEKVVVAEILDELA